MSDQSVLDVLDADTDAITELADRIEDAAPVAAAAVRAMATLIESLDDLDHTELFGECWDMRRSDLAVLLGAVDETGDRLTEILRSAALEGRLPEDVEDADLVLARLQEAREGLAAIADTLTTAPERATANSPAPGPPSRGPGLRPWPISHNTPGRQIT